MKILSTGRARTAALLTTLLALVIGLAGCSAAGSDGEETTVRIQSSAGTVDPLLLADALGHLDGLKLDKVGDVTGGPQSLQALVSKQTDISSGAFYGAIAQLVATGAPIKAVYPTYGTTEKLDQKLVTPEGSPIKSAKDLIGKKVAVNTLGANSEAVLDTWFDQEGLTDAEQDQITLVVLPPLNTPEALKKGQVDAAVVSFSSYELARKTLPLQILLTDREVIGEYAGGGVSLREEWIKKNPTTSRKLVEGIAKAVNFIETHEKQEVFDIYFPYLEKKGWGDYIEPIEQNFPGTLGVAAEATIEDQDISRWVDWLAARGDIDADELEVSDVYTNEFNPYAK